MMDPPGENRRQQSIYGSNNGTGPLLEHEESSRSVRSSMSENDGAAGFMPASPPVAPATLLSNSDRNTSLGSYPVATFVRDWVRTSMGTGNNSIHSRPPPLLSNQFRPAPPPAAGAGETMPLSVRTESDLPSGSDEYLRSSGRDSMIHTASDPQVMGSGREDMMHSTSASAPQIMERGDAVDDTTEYILVDGEMIAYPPPAPNHAEQQFMEDRLRAQMQANSELLPKNCQPKRVRRGVRKLTKLFKRGKDKKQGESSQQQQQASKSTEVDSVTTTQSSIRQQQAEPFGPISLREQELPIDTAANRSLSPVPLPTSPMRQDQNQNNANVMQRPVAGLPQTTGLAPAAAAAAAKTSEDVRKMPPPNQKSPQRKNKAAKKKWGVGRGRRKVPPHASTTEKLEFTADQNKQDNAPDDMGVETQLMTGLAPPSTTDQYNRNIAFPHHLQQDHSGLVATTHDGLRPLDPPSNGDFNNSAAAAARMPPMHPIRETSSSGGSNSVMASYLGTADQVQQAVADDSFILPPDMSIAESFVEEDLENGALKKDDDDEPLSLIQHDPSADYKVDKADTPDVEAMLRRAVLETVTEERDSSDCVPTNLPLPPDLFAAAPSNQQKLAAADRQAVPLTAATSHEPPENVYNDTLKVVMVSESSDDKTWLAQRLRNSQRKQRRRQRTTLTVDVCEWRPYTTTTNGSPSADNNNKSIRCKIWDVQGSSSSLSMETYSNFGAHPGTQSLFYSAQSLYLLVWDLAVHNPKTNRIEIFNNRYGDDDDDDDDDDEDSEFDEEDDEHDDFVREEANRQADRALHADITNRVLSWLDCIAQRGPRSAVLPVALIPEHMSDAEIRRRCDTFQNLLKDHVHRYRAVGGGNGAPKLLTGANDNLLRVHHYGNFSGIQQLQEMVWAIANDPSHSVFDHVGTPVPPGTVLVYEAIQKFKLEHKLVLLDHMLGELGDVLTVDTIVTALRFMASIGEIIYFWDNDDEVLSRYIILSRKWLISALSCILRNDLKRELVENRRFMNMQCIYSDEMYEENDITKALISGKTSSCPLLSDRDAQMLWQSMSFMREASDRYANLVESSTSTPTMFYFLERLLVHSGVFLPLQVRQDNAASLDKSEVFFVPSLLPVAQADPHMWSYMSSEAWTTTLCHSWLFRDGSPSNLMEHLTVRILRDLYEFSRTFQPEQQPDLPSPRRDSGRARTVPPSQESFGEFVQEHNNEALGCVRIHQVVCFKSSMLVKIGTIFADSRTGDLRESFVEVFVAVVDQSSSHSVASDVMRPYMQRVVVSGKGQAGKHGLKLWKGGYKCILDGVRDYLAEVPNVDSQVVCPECLATSSPRIASTWGWDSVLAVAKSGNPTVICLRGHRVYSNLICGTISDKKAPPVDSHSMIREKLVSIHELLPSIVLVGVWDPDSKSIVNIGSGFIADKKAGLIVTAAHVIYQMKDREKRNFAKPYHGAPSGRAVIGVIPDADSDGKHAVFRYFAEEVAHDILNADACVLRITSRLETDVDDKVGITAIDQPERSISTSQMVGQELKSLKMTTKFQLEEAVRITGFNQGGEGIYEQGKHISRSVDVVRGNICRHFKATITDDSSTASDSSTSQHAFIPKDEIVVMCSTISGHSGGPCVNSEGKVVGILSRSDPTERERCYLVPASLIKPMVTRARQLCVGPERLTEKTVTM